jgi:hypothetical protein
LLSEPNTGILIPAGIWAEQHYLAKNSVLTVICNQAYDEFDYIREYSEFLIYRKSLIS